MVGAIYFGIIYEYDRKLIQKIYHKCVNIKNQKEKKTQTIRVGISTFEITYQIHVNTL